MTTMFQQQTDRVNAAPAYRWATKYAESAKTVYDLSMPLLANSSLYSAAEAKHFQELLEATKSDAYKKDKSTEWMTSDAFRLWMQGRQLLMLARAGKTDKAADLAQRMQSALTPSLYRPEKYDGSSAFACWALGYLSAYYAEHNPDMYHANKVILRDAVTYQQHNYTSKKASLSDLMWSYAMAIQATAWAPDRSEYEYYMHGLAQLSGQNGTVAASINALGDDQYPAWLASIVYGAARLMPNPNPEIQAKQMRDLGNALRDARKRSTQEADRMLSLSTEADYRQREPEIRHTVPLVLPAAAPTPGPKSRL